MFAANVLTKKWTLVMTIRLLYNMKKSFRMAPRVQDKVDIPVFSPAERMFLCNLKIAGESYSSICIKFTEKYWKCTPHQAISILVHMDFFLSHKTKTFRTSQWIWCRYSSNFHRQSSDCTETFSQPERTLECQPYPAPLAILKLFFML